MGKVDSEYYRLKEKNKEKLYLFKVGNFYIFLGDDCDYINNYMVLKKTKFSNELDKCGFPINKIDDYLRVFKNLKLDVEVIDEIPNQNIYSILENINIDDITLEDAKIILKEIKKIYGI